MEKNAALKGIEAKIIEGRTEEAFLMISELISCSDDPFTLLTCASLSSTAGHRGGVKAAVSKILRTPLGGRAAEVAAGLAGIGCFSEALDVIRSSNEKGCASLEASLLLALGRCGEALEAADRASELSLPGRIVRVEALSALGRHDEAVRIAKDLEAYGATAYEAGRCYCAALLSADRPKDAKNYLSEMLKADKNSADYNALAAYVFWVQGKTTAAASYAAKAVQADNGHTGAMETLALCMIDKGRYRDAKIVAGAINEKSPGNPAAHRIIEACIARESAV
ncbi:MAG: tetratricopeptide repeat protein [Candidatus Methanoplasma sp.]|jgi:tetratricopeptide (TPR) repeat protein|nr:tetratricopeptide repeat protein [Candidatus Methanoplasma sp.]